MGFDLRCAVVTYLHPSDRPSLALADTASAAAVGAGVTVQLGRDGAEEARARAARYRYGGRYVRSLAVHIFESGTVDPTTGVEQWDWVNPSALERLRVSDRTFGRAVSLRATDWSALWEHAVVPGLRELELWLKGNTVQSAAYAGGSGALVRGLGCAGGNLRSVSVGFAPQPPGVTEAICRLPALCRLHVRTTQEEVPRLSAANLHYSATHVILQFVGRPPRDEGACPDPAGWEKTGRSFWSGLVADARIRVLSLCGIIGDGPLLYPVADAGAFTGWGAALRTVCVYGDYPRIDRWWFLFTGCAEVRLRFTPQFRCEHDEFVTDAYLLGALYTCPRPPLCVKLEICQRLDAFGNSIADPVATDARTAGVVERYLAAIRGVAAAAGRLSSLRCVVHLAPATFLNVHPAVVPEWSGLTLHPVSVGRFGDADGCAPNWP